MYLLNELSEKRTTSDYELFGYVEGLSPTITTTASSANSLVWYRFKVFATRKKTTTKWVVNPNGYIKIALGKLGLEGSFLKIYGTLGKVSSTQYEVLCSRFKRNDITKEWFFRPVSYNFFDKGVDRGYFNRKDLEDLDTFLNCPILYKYPTYLTLNVDNESYSTVPIKTLTHGGQFDFDGCVSKASNGVVSYQVEKLQDDNDYIVRLCRELCLLASSSKINISIDFTDCSVIVLDICYNILSNYPNIRLGKGKLVDTDLHIELKEVIDFLSFNIF